MPQNPTNRTTPATPTTSTAGAAATGDAGSTYAALDRPAWAPPGWLFGPVWTVLYGMIAVAG